MIKSQSFRKGEFAVDRAATPSKAAKAKTQEPRVSNEPFPQEFKGRPEILADFVCRSLVALCDVQPGDISVKNCSGHGAWTFRISAPAARPREVALHLLPSVTASDELCLQRLSAAQRLLASHGLAPCRLVEGPDWFVDEWVGDAVGTLYELRRPPQEEACASPEELGELLAAIHAVPVDWFQELRRRMCLRDGALKVAGPASHIWPFAARRELLRGSRDEALEAWCLAGPRPLSASGARAVTSHGDFHPANIVRASDGALRVVDLGQCCVSCAAKDLSWACEFYLRGLSEKRVFVRSYLAASGLASGSEVDALLLDAECFALHGFWGLLYGSIPGLLKDPVGGLEVYRKFAEVADAASSEPLKMDILEHGFMRCEPVQSLLDS